MSMKLRNPPQSPSLLSTTKSIAMRGNCLQLVLWLVPNTLSRNPFDISDWPWQTLANILPKNPINSNEELVWSRILFYLDNNSHNACLCSLHLPREESLHFVIKSPECNHFSFCTDQNIWMYPFFTKGIRKYNKIQFLRAISNIIRSELRNVIYFTQGKSFKPNFTPWKVRESWQI